MSYISKKDTYEIIGACMDVHSYFGPGFLESVYKEALEVEFKSRGIRYEREKELNVKYKGLPLNSKFYADFLVMDSLILEVKAVSRSNDKFIAQCINYLKVSDNELALLVNFGEESLFYKRIVHSNKR